MGGLQGVLLASSDLFNRQDRREHSGTHKTAFCTMHFPQHGMDVFRGQRGRVQLLLNIRARNRCYTLVIRLSEFLNAKCRPPT